MIHELRGEILLLNKALHFITICETYFGEFIFYRRWAQGGCTRVLCILYM